MENIDSIVGLAAFCEKSLFLTLTPFSRQQIFSVIAKGLVINKQIWGSAYI